MFDGLKETGRLILDTVFPGHCIACGHMSEDGQIFCPTCLAALEIPKGKRCLCCGQPKHQCKCAFQVYHFDRAVSAYYNNGPARAGIYALKFAGKSQVVPFFADAMEKTLTAYFTDAVYDVIVPVPCRRLDRVKRGFDHAALLAQELSRRLSIPLDERALKHRRGTTRQHRMSSYESRFENARKLYAVGHPVGARRVLLVDDILTSGATLDACALLLKRSGALCVDCVTALVGEKTVEKKETIGYNNKKKEEVSDV